MRRLETRVPCLGAQPASKVVIRFPAGSSRELPGAFAYYPMRSARSTPEHICHKRWILKRYAKRSVQFHVKRAVDRVNRLNTASYIKRMV